MNRPRTIAWAGLGAGLLSNYWLLEWWLSERTDTPRSWVSDLATRTEATGWRFQALAILSGLAIAAFAALLLRVIAISPREGVKWRSPARGEGMVRWGLFALLAVGIFATVAGAAPLSCPEGIEPSCTLAEDPADVVHALATGGEIVATVLAFLFLGLAFLSLGDRHFPPRGGEMAITHSSAGWSTLGMGAVWLALTVLTGVAYLSGDVDAVKGLLQRADQILFGVWLALLGLWAAHHSDAPE
ncbi:MAG TPA: DUF998 domain-containing protein [Solirubrobacterales bacterium]|nr:DUF998 domain-containing protein [Solirubrobacterales bacterium]